MVGRKNEREQLEKRYQSDKSEFVAIYGRRRVSKTYLVKEHLKDRFAFGIPASRHMTGIGISLGRER